MASPALVIEPVNPHVQEADPSKKIYTWCFTLHNYTDADLAILDALECTYLIYGKEVGETGETPHLQGVIMFKNQVYFASLKKRLVNQAYHLSRVHKRSTVWHAAEYCKKEGVYIERGEPPVSQVEKGKAGKKSSEERWTEMYTLAQDGKFDELAVVYTREFILYREKFRLIYLTRMSLAVIRRLPHNRLHLWVWGEPGYGKSLFCDENYPDAYRKNLQDPFWQNYNYQKVVRIDEIDKYDARYISYIKIWCDIYAFEGRVKFMDNQLIRPDMFIFNSNFHFEEIWFEEITLIALRRRIHLIRFGPGHYRYQLSTKKIVLAKDWVNDVPLLGPDPYAVDLPPNLEAGEPTYKKFRTVQEIYEDQ